MPENEVELKPCPFDGGKAILQASLGAIGQPDTVYAAYACENRKTTCPVNMRTHYGTEGEAKAMWNRRASDTLAERVAEMEAMCRDSEALLNRVQDCWDGGAEDDSIANDVDALRRRITRFWNKDLAEADVMFDEAVEATTEGKDG